MLKKRNNDHLFVNYQKLFFLSYFIFPLIFFDQISKTLAGKYYFSVCNNFGVFGLVTGGFPVYLGVLLVVAYAIFVERRKLALMGLAFIFAGGLSNIIDRLLIGCVRDFIKILNFPIFNLADVFITFGVVLAIFSLVKNKK